MASGALWCVLLDIRFDVCPAFGGCGCEHFPREPLVVLVDESLHKEGLRKRRAGSHLRGGRGGAAAQLFQALVPTTLLALVCHVRE